MNLISLPIRASGVCLNDRTRKRRADMSVRRFLCFAAVALILICCAGCENPAAVGDGSETRDITQAQPGDTAGEELEMWKPDGSLAYVIVRGNDAGETAVGAAARLRLAVIDAYGLNDRQAELMTDWVKEYDAQELSLRREILVGQTNRTESSELIAQLEPGSYAIAVTGRKIVIAGADERGTSAAVDRFIADCLPDLSRLENGLLVGGTYESAQAPLAALPDTSDGGTRPRLVETVYPTDDIVIADIIVTEDGYGADPTGKHDSTRAIAKALSDCSAGGTVYLPAGVYIVTSQIKIPPYVTLRGDWQDPDAGNDYGTVLALYVKSEDTTACGTIMLGGSGGVVGVTVWYPEQSLSDVKPYPFTFYTDGRGNDFMLSTLKNITVINGYRGIGACCATVNAHEQLTVENFKGTFLCTAAEVYNQSDVGTWQSVTVSGRYWKNAPPDMRADAGDTDKYLLANATGLILGDLEWTEFIGLTVEGCKTGILVTYGKRIQFAGSLYDCRITGCETGLLVEQLDTRWGMVIAGGEIGGTLRGIDNKTEGLVKCAGVRISGGYRGKVSLDGGAPLPDAGGISRTYVKPAARLYVARLESGRDMTSTLQAVLDSAAASGGAVYVPAGVYTFNGALTVPAGVELRGAGSVAARDQRSLCGGTVFLTAYGLGTSNPATAGAFITLAGANAGLNAVRIVYNTNSPYDIKATPYAVRGQAKGVYCVNCSVTAAAYGVDFSSCDGHIIKRLMSCCYINAIKAGGRNGCISGCLQNGTVLCRSAVPGLENWLAESMLFTDLFPLTRSRCVYVMLENADGELIFNTFAYGVRTLVSANDSADTVCLNLGSDNIGAEQLSVSGGTFCGVNLMRYNGSSYEAVRGARLTLINRLTINAANEKNIY